MIACHCPVCGNRLPAKLFVPSKAVIECPDCKRDLLVAANTKEIIIKTKKIIPPRQAKQN